MKIKQSHNIPLTDSYTWTFGYTSWLFFLLSYPHTHVLYAIFQPIHISLCSSYSTLCGRKINKNISLGAPTEFIDLMSHLFQLKCIVLTQSNTSQAQCNSWTQSKNRLTIVDQQRLFRLTINLKNLFNLLWIAKICREKEKKNATTYFDTM